MQRRKEEAVKRRLRWTKILLRPFSSFLLFNGNLSEPPHVGCYAVEIRVTPATRPLKLSPMPLLEIKNLQLDFVSDGRPARAVDGVSLSIEAGETVCLVGESGCGKSVTALSIARLVPTPPARYVGGEILLNGRNVLKMSPSELCDIRGGVVSFVFQEPGASLNPVFRIGSQIKEALKLNTERAIAAGAFGVPTAIVDGEIFWGYDSTDMLFDYCRNPDLFADPEMRRVSTLPIAAARDLSRR